MIMQITTPRLELWRIEGAFRNEPHVHEDDYQVTVPLDGPCLFTHDSRDYRLADGSGLVQHPKDRHSFEIETGASVLIFKIKQYGFREIAGADSPEFALHQQFEPSRMSGRFRQWTNALLSNALQDRLAQEELESQVLSYLERALIGNHRGAAQDRTAMAAADPYMRQALTYIDDHYKEEIRIDTLAAIALLSRFHFIRSFKAAVGQTPYQYVLRLRMDEAKRLLRRTGLSVTDIAYSLGFASISQFYRSFAKSVGTSPEKYRHQC